MLEAPLRAPVPGSTLPRLLARLAGADEVPPPQSPAARLGEWLDWPRAVALAHALDGPAADGAGVDADVDAEACTRARDELVRSITGERGWPAADATAEAAAAAVLRHCQSLQRAMQSATGRLRGQLRERLAQQSPAQARLAAVDAVLEGVTSPREHALLAPVPALLAAHCGRLHKGAANTPVPGAASHWLALFREDARQVLLAELDLRFQPVAALLAALRPSSVDA